MAERKHLVAQPVHKPIVQKKSQNRQLWAKVAYYYPQYTLQEASKLSLRDIKLLLKVAGSIEAERYFNLTQIAAAPHSEKGKGVNNLIETYRKRIL